MAIPGLHPSLSLLLVMRTTAALRRTAQKLRDPRHRVSVVIAAVLAGLWLLNAAASIWLREAADPRAFEMMLAGSLTAYLVWHLVRTACFPPESPLEQPAQERELLAAMPLQPGELVAHHVANMAVVAVAKATLMATLLLPDLPLPPVAWVGVLAALLAVELSRQGIEIVVWSLSPAGLRLYRTAVVLALVFGGSPTAGLGRQLLSQGRAASEGNFLSVASTAAVAMHETWLGGLTCGLWRPFLEVILAQRLSLALLGTLAQVGFLLAALIMLVRLVHRRRTTVVARRERRAFLAYRNDPPSAQPGSIAAASARDRSFPRVGVRRRTPLVAKIPSCGGMVALFWRQARGAGRHAWGLLVAMMPPALLALSPLGASGSPEATFLAVAGALAFYTFLLLPTALKFDFRRDLDRMALLKSLPVGAWGVAIGQLAAPVALATLFQGLVLGVCQYLRPVAPVLPFIALGLFLLMNALVFAVDNLVFLKSPHRLQQEGLSVLLRTMLTFTAKGVLFGAGLALTLAWQIASQTLAADAATRGWSVSAGGLFVAGMAIVLGVVVAATVALLARTFTRFDPAQHRA